PVLVTVMQLSSQNIIIFHNNYHVIFLMKLRPPWPPLFPYTTLFRSHGVDLIPFFGPPEGGVFRLFHDGGLVAPSGLINEIGTIWDRKSTRLNSSHVKISYAVFCLTKKKDSDKHNKMGATTQQQQMTA